MARSSDCPPLPLGCQGLAPDAGHQLYRRGGSVPCVSFSCHPTTQTQSRAFTLRWKPAGRGCECLVCKNVCCSVLFVLPMQGFTTMVTNEGLEKARSY